MKNSFQLLFMFVSVLIFNIKTSAQLEYPGDVDILGSAEVLFSSSTDSCSSENIPDAPVRFFRDANDQIQVIISHFEGYRMIGPDFSSLTVDCSNGPVWTSHFDNNPSNYNNKEWLTGLYTLDGKTIYSLVHNEHEGGVLSNWYNSVTLAVSNDTGKTYSHASPPDHLVASIPYTYQDGMGPAGVFEPSNIIYHNGYYYVMLHMESYGLQETGASIMRTQDLSDPTSWEVWDGDDFNNTFINPYTQTNYDPADHIAAILDYSKIEKMHSSITWNTYFNKFLLVGSAVKDGVWGFYYSLSEDLIHWSTRKLIMEANVNIHAQPGSDVYGYPAIVDHNDTTRNFEVTGQDVYLYYTRWPYGENYNRTLERIPIRFNKQLVNGFVVTSTEDNEDTDWGDGLATNQSGQTSLRSAIEEANARPYWYRDSVISISFNIDGPGVQTITLQNTFPSIFYPVKIDGFTQPGASSNTNTFEDGSNAVPLIRINADGNLGIETESNHTIIKGLIINNYSGSAISVNGVDSCIIEGNFIGTSADGLSNVTPDGTGIEIKSGNYNRIGGTTPAAANIILGGVSITGSSSYNTIEGNYIGTDKTGTVALSRNSPGVQIKDGAHNNTVGGSDSASRNLISGNWMQGVLLSGNGAEQNTVLNNYIGVAPDGYSTLPNTFEGVGIYNGAHGAIIGQPGAGNVISGNGEMGIRIEHSSNITIQGNYIGTAADGVSDAGNTEVGILLFNNSSNDLIGGTDSGTENVIAHNGAAGVVIAYGETKNNAVLGNSIYQNGLYGIDLYWDGMVNENDLMDEDDGPNGFQNFPEIDQAQESDSLIVSGTFYSKPNRSYTLQFFVNDSADASGYGEGQTFIGSRALSLGADGQKDFRFSFPSGNYVGKYITATATDDSNNTSEFSNALIIRGQTAQITVSTNYIELHLYQNSTELTELVVSNVGVEPLNWSASWNESWLSLSSDSGSIAPGSDDSLSLLISTANLNEGVFFDTISIMSNDPVDSVVSVSIALYVTGSDYKLDVSTDSLWVGLNQNDSVTVTFYIGNGGGQDKSWWLVQNSNTLWMNLLDVSDTIGGNQTDTVRISFNSTDLPNGDFSNILYLYANDSANYDRTIKIQFTVGNFPKVAVETDTLKFELVPGGFQSLPLVIKNSGRSNLEWSIHWTFYSQWIKPSPTNGITPPNGEFTVNVNVSANDLDSTYAEGVLMVVSNDPNTEELKIPVQAVIKPPTGIEDGKELPTKFSLTQNYPNPFNPSTIIEYAIPVTENKSPVFVQLKIYDVLGNEVTTLVNETKSPGYYSAVFNANNLPSGFYLYRLTAGNFTSVKKMILMK